MASGEEGRWAGSREVGAGKGRAGLGEGGVGKWRTDRLKSGVVKALSQCVLSFGIYSQICATGIWCSEARQKSTVSV